MKISREDVVRVAELAYLDLSEAELETYRKQVDEILEYIGKLNELDTTNVEPMAQVLTDDQTAMQRCAKMSRFPATLPPNSEAGARSRAAVFPRSQGDRAVMVAPASQPVRCTLGWRYNDIQRTWQRTGRLTA